jgi:hypothetical protein
MSSFRVRLRLPSKQETLTLPPPVTIRALLEGVQSFVGGDIDRIGLKFGYPPKEVNLGDSASWDEDVSTIGLKNGETLIVTTSGEPKEPTAEQPGESKVESTPAQLLTSPPVQPKRDYAATQNMLTPGIDPTQENPSQAKRGRSSAEDEPPEIPVEGGSVVLRIMADDNSCMYIHLFFA